MKFFPIFEIFWNFWNFRNFWNFWNFLIFWNSRQALVTPDWKFNSGTSGDSIWRKTDEYGWWDQPIIPRFSRIWLGKAGTTNKRGTCTYGTLILSFWRPADELRRDFYSVKSWDNGCLVCRTKKYDEHLALPDVFIRKKNILITCL